jgi:Dimerisation domain
MGNFRMKTQPSADRIWQVTLGYAASKVLSVAIELGLFSALAKGSLDAESIGQKLRFHPRALHDFVDALVAAGLLACDGKSYANTAETDFYLDAAKPIILMALSSFRPSANITFSIRSKRG